MLPVGKSMEALKPTSESDPSRTSRRLGCDISRGGSLTTLCRSISPVRVDDDIALGHSMDMTPYFRDRENARLTGRGDPGDLTAHGFADLVLDPEESEMSLQGRFVVGEGGGGGLRSAGRGPHEGVHRTAADFRVQISGYEQYKH